MAATGQDEAPSVDREVFAGPDVGLRDLLVAKLAGRYGAFDPDGDGDSARGDWNTVVAEVILPTIRSVYAEETEALRFIHAELARGDREARDLIAKVKWPDCMAALVNLYSDVLRNINVSVNPDT